MRKLFLISGLLFAGGVARADVSGDLTFKTDDRFRGRSLSEGRPVLEANVTVEADKGLYGGASATLILTGERRQGLQGVEAYIGYVQRLDTQLSVDAGVVGYAYTSRFSGNRRSRYAEVYAGINAGQVSAYLHYTPNYLDRNLSTLYVDLSAAKRLGTDWTVKAHAGLLVQTSGPPGLGKRSRRFDTRLALSRQILGLDTELGWTFAGPRDAYYAGPWKGRSAVTLALSKHF